MSSLFVISDGIGQRSEYINQSIIFDDVTNGNTPAVPDKHSKYYILLQYLLTRTYVLRGAVLTYVLPVPRT